jgi:hypothetical protein
MSSKNGNVSIGNISTNSNGLISGKGRKAGTTNYKKEILLNVIATVLPSGAEGWNLVAQKYQIKSAETFLRDATDLKRHFTEKLCDRNRTRTGH